MPLFNKINTKKELIKEAFLRGHAWNPAFATAHNIDENNVDLLTGSEPEAIQLLQSYQHSSSRYDMLVESIHQRFEPLYDGEAGPATFALANTPRCPLPDFAPPPGATFHYDDPDLQSVVERMQWVKEHSAKELAGTGSGSWKPGCYGNSSVHEIKVSYDDRKLSSKQKEWLPKVKEHNAMAVAAMGLKIIEVPVGEKANVEFYGRSFGGSTIGMAQFNNTSCNDSVFCTVSSSYAPNFRMFLILSMHEFGHTMNFEHSNRFIMNPFIMDVPEYWVQRDSLGVITYEDVRYKKGKQFFGGDPVGPVIPTPTPIQTPEFFGELYGEQGPNGISIRGVIDVIVREGQKPGTFKQIVVPSVVPGRFKFEPKTEL